MMYEELKDHVGTWRERLAGQQAFSASEIQDRLFDLYGDLEGSTALEIIKTWLLLTRQRDLFGADELAGLLDEVELEVELASLEEPTPA